MSIHTEQVDEIQGFDKEIEAGSLSLILDNLQLYQYEHPQKSTVRELVSNGLDAIWEKKVALRILAGESKSEEYFLQREDAINRDSNWEPKYYDQHWLWDGQHTHTNAALVNYTPDDVYITYEDGGDQEKDHLVIEDFGVGLGGTRLEGYFKIGLTRLFLYIAA